MIFLTMKITIEADMVLNTNKTIKSKTFWCSALLCGENLL